MAKSSKKRDDNRFASSVYIGTVSGKRKYKYVYGKTKKEADEKARELKMMLGKGIDFNSGYSKFSEWKDIWVMSLERKLTKTQYESYKYRIEIFNDYVGKMNVTQIKLFQLQEVIDSLADDNPTTHKPSSKKTLIYYKMTINQFFEYLIDNRIVDYNPAKNLTIPSDAPKNKRRALTRKEINMVIDFNHRAQLPCMIAMFAGLRKGEICALQWSDIDFDNKVISITKSLDLKTKTIKPPKTEAGIRKVTIPKVLYDFLKVQPRRSIYVVTNTKDELLSESNWKKLWKSYLYRLNKSYGDFSKFRKFNSNEKTPMIIDEFTIHCLRHTYATMLYDAGVDVLTARDLLGHADIKTTLGIYTHLSAENKKHNIDKLNDFLNETSYKGDILPFSV